ncbi:MAG: glycosyltransferase family 87 protein, partial [Planctomycetota bacterium]
MEDHLSKANGSGSGETLSPAAPSHRLVAAARIAAYIVLGAGLIIPMVQFQVQTRRNVRKAAKFDAKYPDWTPAVATDGGPQRPKSHKGAIGRWAKAVRAFWNGENIYRKKEQATGGADSGGGSRIWLHPNTPFTLILLTPFAYMPAETTAFCWSLLKLIAIVASVLMLRDIASHTHQRPPDWVIGLGLVWTITMIGGDIVHGNTNIFVLAAVVFHLWLYRRGFDIWAGAPLALAICLKMTPAIFLLYWAYQRNWKLLIGAIAGLAIMGILIPAVAIGPNHYATLTQSWLENLIVPGLFKGAWYPVHINQSISGVFSRYFLEGPNGNIFWNPDDNPYETQEM